MSDSPFSVRMNDADKSEITSLINESGKSNKDFMNELISTYKLNKMKIEVPEMSEDIKHLEAIISQISEIYIGIGKRITTIEEANSIQYTKELSIYKEKIISLENTISTLTIDKDSFIKELSLIKSSQEEKEKQLSNFQNTINDKNKLLEDKSKLIEEYRDKNDNLLSMLKDLKSYKEKVDTLSDLLADSQTKNITLQNEITRINNEHENILNKVTAKNDYATHNLKSKIIELEDSLIKKDQDNLKELENLKKSMEYEKDKALLEQEKEFNKTINDINHENNTVIAALQEKSNNQMFDYQKQINSLLKKNIK